MNAIVYRKNGPPEKVLTFENVDKPVPGDREVLIKVRAAAMNPLDVGVMKGGPALTRLLFGPRKPKVPGVDAAGVVEAVGRGVTQFKAGDAVFGSARGAFAECAVAPESKLAAKPDSVSFEDAAATPIAALTALQGLRDKGRIGAGQSVLIIGASGGVGTFAVQLGKVFGAHVTAVCSARNAELVRSLGAERVIDYAVEDYAKGTARYDLIFDLAGNHSFAARQRVMTPRGICVGAGVLDGPKSLLVMFGGLIVTLVRAKFSRQEFSTFVAKINREDLAFIGQLLASGTLKPVIDKRYTLNEVPEAVHYQGTLRARGKLVINVCP
ncbi:NAD(P)-dependent alcohol dehydrogenase [Alloacidobacterium sp.]|uniref:NAD(P)-dependent alcohol dehydrogenase n=1 Tax=Alloacidobacterium sp. TaxID=2951999 RepID=UPI002D29B5FB|nr:NAD(P)-dependent alcohol dehydrogenase [Alloacidobacterium sp.]HYK36251.1 NAD(P)-dependent alcohol dehydrogenase [Alloacidobacterium sp.]